MVIQVTLYGPADYSPALLRRLMKGQGQTQKATAGLLGVSVPAVRHWLRDERRMPTGLWELYLLRCGLHEGYITVPRRGMTEENQE